MEAHSSQKSSVPSDAFIFYGPKAEGIKEQVSYNEEAWRVLSLTALPPSQGDPPPDLSSLCSRWRGLLDQRLDEWSISGKTGEPGLGFIDLYQSRRRRYAVRGILLTDHPSASPKQANRYLFILERIYPDELNLSLLSRQWGLNRREKEIVRLLFTDKSNKEMAHTLGISPNTFKGYLKLLMGKLGVGSRCGIIACLLTGRNPSSPPPP